MLTCNLNKLQRRHRRVPALPASARETHAPLQRPHAPPGGGVLPRAARQPDKTPPRGHPRNADGAASKRLRAHPGITRFVARFVRAVPQGGASVFEQAQLQQRLAVQSRTSSEFCGNAEKKQDAASPPSADGVPQTGKSPRLAQLLQRHAASLRPQSRPAHESP